MDQVDSFVAKAVAMLKIGGDGIDLDWEHLGQDLSIKAQQTKTTATVLNRLRKAFDANGLADKAVGWTTRFNAFYNDETRPAGYDTFPSDGEGLLIEEELVRQGTSLRRVVSWANIMFYDMRPDQVAGHGPNGLTLENYKVILSFFERFMDKR